MVAFAGAVVLSAATPTAAVAQEHAEAKAAHAAALRTSYRVTRESKNQCAYASFQYTYTARGDGFYDIEIANGFFEWSGTLDKCGVWGEPYAPVLQWQADTNTEGHFDWTVYSNGNEGVTDLVASGFKNVRFRVCNWNTTTGFVGTCGSS